MELTIPINVDTIIILVTVGIGIWTGVQELRHKIRHGYFWRHVRNDHLDKQNKIKE